MEFVGRVKTAKIGSLICAAVFCIIGVLMIAYPGASLTVICRAAGVTLIGAGILRLIGYVSGDIYRLAFQHDLTMGLLSVILGMLFLTRTDAVIRMFHVMIGLFVLADGLLKLQTSKDAKCFGLPKWWLITLTAAFAVVFGGVLLFSPMTGAKSLMLIGGIGLVILGILNLTVVLITVVVSKKRKEKIITLDESEYKEEDIT